MVRNELEGSESVDGGSNPYTTNQNLTNQLPDIAYLLVHGSTSEEKALVRTYPVP